MGRLGTVLAAAGVAAVLGTAGGVLSAVSTERTPPHAAVKPTLTRADDPLRLGVRKVDLPVCDGSTLVVVGWGDTQTALSPAVLEHPDARYLEAASSCATAFPAEGGAVPRYLVYLPPFETPSAACEERMERVLKGSFATVLHEGNTEAVVCGCYIKAADLLVVGLDVKQTAASGMSIKLYQRMLIDAGLLPRGSDTGVFDDATRTATFILQTDNGLNPSGNVNSQTWRLVQSAACSLYDYGI